MLANTAATNACKCCFCKTITGFQEPQHLIPLQNYYRIARTTTSDAVSKTRKYCSYKTITGLQEPQHLMLFQRRVNTALKKLLQDCKNHNILYCHKGLQILLLQKLLHDRKNHNIQYDYKLFHNCKNCNI